MPDNASLFAILKTIHLITLTITISGFVVRGIWMMQASPLLDAKLVKVLPHINDTLLFGSALGAAALLGQYPFVNDWLTAKVFGALAYIVLGAFALHYAPTRRARIACFAGALLCFAYVVSVAVTKNPLLIAPAAGV